MRKLLYILIIVSSFCTNATAKNTTVAAKCKKIHISNISIQKNNETLNIGFNIESAKGVVGSKHKIILIPYIWNGTDTLRLETITIIGKNKYRREKQERFLAGNKTPVNESRLFKKNIKSRQLFECSYKDWMNGCSLGIEQYEEGCCSTRLVAKENLQTSYKKTDTTYTIEPYLDTIPDPLVAGAIKKWNFNNKEMIIDFRVSRTKIDSSLFENRVVLTEILDAVNSIIANPLTILKEIEITGYASPEGTIKHNIELGENRAKALKTYIQNNINNVADSLFKLNNGVENWVGLRKMVDTSRMMYKIAVLDFIDSTKLIDPITKVTKNNKLKQIFSGEPYKYVLKNFYPHLRNAIYISVFYETLTDSTAQTINNSVELIRRKNYEAALEKLLPLSEDSRTWNAIGVCCMMKEEYEEAKQWFEKAIAEGDKLAIKNLEQINNCLKIELHNK